MLILESLSLKFIKKDIQLSEDRHRPFLLNYSQFYADVTQINRCVLTEVQKKSLESLCVYAYIYIYTYTCYVIRCSLVYRRIVLAGGELYGYIFMAAVEIVKRRNVLFGVHHIVL